MLLGASQIGTITCVPGKEGCTDSKREAATGLSLRRERKKLAEKQEEHCRQVNQPVQRLGVSWQETGEL